MTGKHEKGRAPRTTVELFVEIKENKRRKRWEAKCKFIPCDWKNCGANEFLVSRAWVQHFTEVHVAHWDKR